MRVRASDRSDRLMEIIFLSSARGSTPPFGVVSLVNERGTGVFALDRECMIAFLSSLLRFSFYSRVVGALSGTWVNEMRRDEYSLAFPRGNTGEISTPNGILLDIASGGIR